MTVLELFLLVVVMLVLFVAYCFVITNIALWAWFTVAVPHGATELHFWEMAAALVLIHLIGSSFRAVVSR